MMIAEGRGPQRPDGHPVIIDLDWDIIQRYLLPSPELRPSADGVLDLGKFTILFYDTSRSVDHSPPVGARVQPRNFIIFGEMGVGKSALVNLIAGEQLSKTCSGAHSCTLESTPKVRPSMLVTNTFLACLNHPTEHHTRTTFLTLEFGPRATLFCYYCSLLPWRFLAFRKLYFFFFVFLFIVRWGKAL